MKKTKTHYTAAKRLEYILDVIEEGVWEWNTNTGEVKRSPGWYQMLGYPPNYLPPNVITWENTIHPEDYPRVMAHFEDYLNGLSPNYSIEYRCHKTDGDYLWVHDQGKIVDRNPDGSPALMVGAHTNIHAHKSAQLALQRQTELFSQNKLSLEDLLESLIKSRTDELIKMNQEMEKNLQEIEKLRNLDHLTSIYNRGKLEIELNKEISRARRYQSPLSVTLFDIDHFKQINDNYGHAIGDQALQSISRLVLNNLRETDIAGRWGGDEFILLLPGIDHEQALNVVEKLRELIENSEFVSNIKITCSFGVTSVDKDDTIGTIYKRADQALYKAKHLGRNRVVAI